MWGDNLAEIIRTAIALVFVGIMIYLFFFSKSLGL